MKKYSYRIKLKFFVFVSLCLCVYFLLWKPPTYAQDKIVAIVNNDVITQKDLNDFVNFMRIQLSSELRGLELESKIQSMKLDLLNKLTEDRLILQEAKKNNLKIEDNRVREKINEVKKNYPTDIEFQNALAKEGLVLADIETRIREQLLMYSIIDREVRSKVKINPAEITEFYRKNIEEFKLPVQFELDSIAVKEESVALKILAKLKMGGNFEELSKEFSATLSKLNTAQDGRLRSDIEAVVLKMQPGDISEPVKIGDDYYIFKLNNLLPIRQQSLSEAQEKIYSFLINKKMQEIMSKWLDELKSRSYIKIIKD